MLEGHKMSMGGLNASEWAANGQNPGIMHAYAPPYLNAVDVEQALLGRDEAEVDDVHEGPDLPRRRHAAHEVLLDLGRELVDAVGGYACGNRANI